MLGTLEKPPLLSTPDSHHLDPSGSPKQDPRLPRSDQLLCTVYEIDRTVTEIKEGQWTAIALQFPDDMLDDAPAVVGALNERLRDPSSLADGLDAHVIDTSARKEDAKNALVERSNVKLYILADTSYGSCCVDEVAAEHVEADVVVHYGRACLSPTSRLPVIHIFTIQPLEMKPLIGAFENTFPDYQTQIIVMADVTYSFHLPRFAEELKLLGYVNIHTANVVHDPASPLPNRTIPDELGTDLVGLKRWRIFHISDPPDSLLLILSSRVAGVHVFPTSRNPSNLTPQSLTTSTGLALRKRYAYLTSVSTASIIGILINTLSVRNYLHIVKLVKDRIRAAGKKSYTFVVGKINTAKLANFSEIGGWVVVGCWESSLLDSKDFWKPILTPFELDLALQKDGERVWTGEWSSDFQSVLSKPNAWARANDEDDAALESDRSKANKGSGAGGLMMEPESSPPDFDLRRGRYVSGADVSHRVAELSSEPISQGDATADTDKSLVSRPKGDLTTGGGVFSQGAEYFKSKSSWRGLGSDFEIAYDEPNVTCSAIIEEGKGGIARGYYIGEETTRT